MRTLYMSSLLTLGLGLKLMAQPDSSRVLGFQAFYQQVLAFHPVVSQAYLLPEEARRILQEARGNFDPKLQFDLSRKRFAGTDYYNFAEGYLKVPVLPLGIEVKAGYERNVTGFKEENLDPYFRTPFDGQAYAGVLLPLGQNLVTDARRNALRQAEVFQKLAEADKAKLLNKLMLSAAKEYWNWYFAYKQFLLVRTGYQLAEVRFKATQARTLAEDAAPIDTVEALITLQDRKVQLQEAVLEWQNARLMLSNFLWSDQHQPMELREEVRPDTTRMVSTVISQGRFEELLAQAENTHPDILKYTFKIRQLWYEERFRREMLKPVFNLEYSFLSYYPNIGAPLGDKTHISDNYKLGLNFSFPLLLRKERGKWQQVRIKQLQNEYERSQTRREVLNQLRASYNELKNLEQQLRVQEEVVRNQERLVKAEYQRFDIGESSLFLINTRENKLIDYRIKLESLKTKYEKGRAELIYAAGLSRLEN